MFTLVKSSNDAPATKDDIQSFDINYNYEAQWLYHTQLRMCVSRYVVYYQLD